MKPGLSDTIFLERLSLKGRHGVHDREREIEQEFFIDISASFDTRPASSSDMLADTLDYSRFRAIAEEVVGGEPCFLIETIAERIAQRILQDDRVEAVSVAIRKPAVFSDALPGISITRTRV